MCERAAPTMRRAASSSGNPPTPVPNATRLQGYYPIGKSFRCPGGATQPPPDGSAPWLDSDGDLDCDPSTVPPGP